MPWGSVVTGNPKGGIAETLDRFRGGTTQISLENEDMWWGGGGEGGDRVSHQKLLGGITSGK